MMKEKYLSVLRDFKAQMEADIEAAIDETSRNAFSEGSELELPLSRTLWEYSSTQQPRDLTLYRLNVKSGNPLELTKALYLRIEKALDYLPDFPLNTPVGEGDTPLPTCPKATLTVSNVQNVTIRSEAERKKCMKCDVSFHAEDAAYQCKNACLCGRCCIEWLVRNQKQDCPHCSHPFPSIPSLPLYTTCHVCNLVVSFPELERSIPCSPCRRCVTITHSTFFGITMAVKGSCSKCPSSALKYNLDDGIYPLEKDREAACCGKDGSRREKLRCGHLVCAAHKDILRQCRACQSPITP